MSSFCAQDSFSGQVKGLLADYIHKTAGGMKNSTIRFEAIAYPTLHDAMKALQDGRIDCVFPAEFSAYEADKNRAFEAGMNAHVPKPFDAAKLYAAIHEVLKKGMTKNSLLPDDIVVKEAWEADADFSARHSAKAKTYIYRIQQGETPDPLTARYAWYERRPLDIGLMQQALDMLEGTHDFSAFRAAGGAPMSPVRTIYEARIEEKPGNLLEFTIYGNGFLYHMVRNIIGTVANVGLGRIRLERFAAIFASFDRHQARATAPACGLYLYSVEY